MLRKFIYPILFFPLFLYINSQKPLLSEPKNNIEVADYVLQNFDEDESIDIERISKNITDSLSILVEKKLDLFSSAVNNK